MIESRISHNSLECPLDTHMTEIANPVLTLLLEAGSPVDARNARGLTGLHIAASNGSVGNVRALVYYNADVMLKTPDGKTALDLASDATIKNILETEESKIKERWLAFTMGQHKRLGSQAIMHDLHPELVKLVVDQCAV